jgi:hypothetical protein
MNPQSGTTVKEGSQVNIVVNKQPTKSTLTVNLNLKSFMNYTEPQPVTETKKDEFGNDVTTTTTAEVATATVAIKVGDDTILNDVYKLNKTDITKTWTTSGVKELKILVDGVTKFTQTVDFNKGNQVVNVN